MEACELPFALGIGVLLGSTWPHVPGPTNRKEWDPLSKDQNAHFWDLVCGLSLQVSNLCFLAGAICV